MSNLSENQKLINKYRFILAFVIDKEEKVTFLISGKSDIPDFLSKEMEIILTSKDIEPDEVYRPFHLDVGEDKISDDHPAKRIFGDKSETNYLGDYEKITFTPDFLSRLSKEEKQILEDIYSRELEILEKVHLGYRTSNRGDLTLSSDQMSRFIDLMDENPLLFIREDDFKKEVVNLPGIGKKTAFILWEVVFENPYEVDHFRSGGTSNYIHSVNLMIERDNISQYSTEASKFREKGKQLDFTREKVENKEELTTTEVSEEDKKAKDETSDVSSKQDETKESRGITRNPFLWMIAIAIVVWWKWDEIKALIS